MKNYIFLPLLLIFFNISSNYAQQITTDDSLSLEQLIQNSFGQNCVEISNVSSNINGLVYGFSSFGYFERGSSNFPFENGILLTTGNVNSAGNVLNTTPLNEGTNAWGTDIDLENALGITETLNATSIQFEFLSVANQIQFNYLLASEEYFADFPCFFSDGFAFLIRLAGSSDPFTNIALIPGTNTPVNTNTIHEQIEGFCPASNEIYFEGYNIGDTNYNGRTVVLTATAAIIPNTTYEIKLIIADQRDKNADSAVFIEGNSFNATVDLGPDITTCGNSVTLNADIENSQANYQWFLDNVLLPNENSTTLEATASGTYKVEITIQLNQTSCIIEDKVEITLNSEQQASNISDLVVCDDNSADGVEIFDLTFKNNEVLSTVPPSTYAISYHFTLDDAQNNSNAITNPIENTSSPQPIFVRIEDTVNGCLAFSTFNLVVNQIPEFNEPEPITVCEDPTQDGFTFVNLNPAIGEITNGNNNLFVTFHFSAPEAEFGINPIFSPYVNSNVSQTLFVRIFDVTTGCFTRTTIEVEFQNSPLINQETQWINACEQDFDGFENFDLTSVIANVLQGLTDVEVSFHETLFDAQNNSNPIANPENYQNFIANFQLIYLRVEDNVTGCYTVTELELHANIIQTGFNLEAFIVCDDPSNDGIENFDLLEVEEALVNGYSEFETTFYATEEDRDNEINALDKSVPFTVTNGGTTIFAIVVSSDCTEFVTVTLEIAPAILLEPQTADFCDQDTDGFTVLVMNTFNSVAAQGVQAANVKYYLTEEDAINNENILPDFVFNNSNPQQFFIRVTNTQTGCFDITSLEVNIVSAPQVLSPTPIVVCDDDQDGISTVNLENKIPEITSETNDILLSFHENFDSAFDGVNPIANPENYTTSTRFVYARVENAVTGCFSISGFFVYINTLPEFIPISNFENCEANISGVADFFFYLKDNEILNNQPDKEVLYFETEADAEAGTNPINKFAAYQNTSSPQTIYVRVQNFTDPNCYGTSSFELEVGSLPIFNPAENLFVCDDVSNDAIVTIDLNETIAAMSAGSPENLNISFYTNEFDANNASNPVALNYTNSTNPQQLFARVENGTNCYGISNFAISVISVPIVNQASPFEQCDDDYDGIVNWDLTISETEILDVRQDNITVSYFETLEDLEANINPISNPENYFNITNPQTVFVKVNNTISNCFVNIPLDLIVNLPPAFIDFETVEICDNPTSSFNLTTVNELLVTDQTNISFTYYSNQTDADSAINQLDNNFIYTQDNHSFIVRLEYNDTGCYTTYPFQLIINPLPIAFTPPNLETCDDSSNDAVEIFNLSAQTPSILGAQSQDAFSVSYHTNLTDATNGSNSLETNYTGNHEQMIYARVENNLTGCFNVTNFIIIINPHPEIPNPLIECDADYDGSTFFNLTAAESDLFQFNNPENSLSYFETLEDLQNDSNPILNPENYVSTSNPQVVFIKVYNNVADCFTSVPLELITNLPPAINNFQTFEICFNDDQEFNLNEINNVIVDDISNLTINYFTSESDAQNNINALAFNYNYISNNDLLFVRVTNNTTGCHIVSNFILQVNPLPVANQPNDLEACDDNFDGFLFFDLSQQNNPILGGQNPNNFSVSYYLTQADAENAINTLDTDYEALDMDEIFVRVENNTTGCYNTTQFSITINPRPIVEIPTQVICLDVGSVVVSANTNNPDDSYLWSTSETTPEIEIEQIGSYAVTITTIFGCETSVNFEVIESEPANIEVVEVIDFSDPNNITITVNGIGNYAYSLDGEAPQTSNVFENVTLGFHTITIIDLNGCSEITREVVVIDAPKFMTPNNDGFFDTWHISGVETLPGTIVNIFDRYGKLLTTLNSSSPGWNGIYNGNLMPTNDYWFVADVVRNDIRFQVKGHFTLKR